MFAHRHTVVLMLVQRQRRWTIIKTTLCQYMVFNGMIVHVGYSVHFKTMRYTVI